MKLFSIKVVAFLGGFSWSLMGATLPKDLKWETPEAPELIADPEAKPGGIIRLPMATYPLTLRTVGPDSNTVLYGALLGNNLSLVSFHPNNDKPIAMMATSWAFGKDGKTVFYKLNKNARWSDGKPVTADDYVFSVKFYRSKNIQAPFYNTYYTEQLSDIVKYDSHTIAVILPNPKPNMLYNTSMSPLPKHFYKGDVPKDFVTKYNWKAAPNTGPYYVDERKMKKGKTVTFVRKSNWWAASMPFFKNRFNVKKVIFKVVREETIQWEHFKKGLLDYFVMSGALYWHERSKIDIFKKGYARKMEFYNDQPRMAFGIWLNTSYPLFKDKRVREAVAYASNMDKVINTILRKEAVRMNSTTHGYGKFTNPNVVARGFDLKKAGKLLDEAGYSKMNDKGIRMNAKGDLVRFNLLYGSDRHKDKLVVVVEEMRKAGIDMVLEQKDWSAVIKQTNANKHQAQFTGFGARSSGIPTYWSIFHMDTANKPNSNNNANLVNKKLSELITAFREGTKEDARIKLAHEIQEIIHDEAVFIPTWVRPYFRVAYWKWWRFPKVPATNKSATAFDIFSDTTGGLFWQDKKLKEATKDAMDDGKSVGEKTVIDRTFEAKKSS